MIPLSPSVVKAPHAGLKFSKAAGHLFRPISVDDTGNLLLWDREFTGLFGKVPGFGRFLAEVEFSAGGAEVIFSRFEGGREVLTDSLGLDQGARLPRNLYLQLRQCEAEFRRLIDGGALTEQQVAFVRAFVLPNPVDFPAAYRIRKGGFFSRKKLYVLWGMVPEAPRAQPTIRMGGAFIPDHGDNESSDEPAACDAVGSSILPDDAPGSGEVVYDEESEWPRWVQLLLWLMGLLLTGAILWLLFSLLLSGCETSDNFARSNLAPASPSTLAGPPLDERKRLLEMYQQELQKQPPSEGLSERSRALDNAIKRQEQAADADKEYRQADVQAETAKSQADITQTPNDRTKAQQLRGKADALKGESDMAQKRAIEAFRSPQETERLEALDELEQQKAVIGSAQAHKKAEADAKDAQSKADQSNKPADTQNAEKLREKADGLKIEADEALKRAKEAVKSPEKKQELEALKDASPEEQEKLANKYNDLNSKHYVTPKHSPTAGEVLVRRFKPDEIVPKRGLRLHLEAEANGRRDFRVKGWRLGLNTPIPNERLEEFVPIGPDLDVDVPLDLSFEYRGSDGMIHEDNAPFTLKGNLEIIPRIDIERYKEIEGDSKPKPTPAQKFNPKTGA